jgi:nucleoside-diphosphate kinase
MSVTKQISNSNSENGGNMDNTLLLIKPNSVNNKNVGEIISIIEKDGFIIEEIKILHFDQELCNDFYAEHVGKSFFPGLVDFMTSGNTFALKLLKENAVSRLRRLVGSANPNERESGTIRDIYADSISHNAVHGSDSTASAQREIKIIFG